VPRNGGSWDWQNIEQTPVPPGSGVSAGLHFLYYSLYFSLKTRAVTAVVETSFYLYGEMPTITVLNLRIPNRLLLSVTLAVPEQFRASFGALSEQFRMGLCNHYI